MTELLQSWTGPVPPIVPPGLIFDAIETADDGRCHPPDAITISEKLRRSRK
jgi:hypothetical protein